MLNSLRNIAIDFGVVKNIGAPVQNVTDTEKMLKDVTLQLCLADNHARNYAKKASKFHLGKAYDIIERANLDNADPSRLKWILNSLNAIESMLVDMV